MNGSAFFNAVKFVQFCFGEAVLSKIIVGCQGLKSGGLEQSSAFAGVENARGKGGPDGPTERRRRYGLVLAVTSPSLQAIALTVYLGIIGFARDPSVWLFLLRDS